MPSAMERNFSEERAICVNPYTYTVLYMYIYTKYIPSTSCGTLSKHWQFGHRNSRRPLPQVKFQTQAAEAAPRAARAAPTRHGAARSMPGEWVRSCAAGLRKLEKICSRCDIYVAPGASAAYFKRNRLYLLERPSGRDRDSMSGFLAGAQGMRFF